MITIVTLVLCLPMELWFWLQRSKLPQEQRALLKEAFKRVMSFWEVFVCFAMWIILLILLEELFHTDFITKGINLLFFLSIMTYEIGAARVKLLALSSKVPKKIINQEILHTMIYVIIMPVLYLLCARDNLK